MLGIPAVCATNIGYFDRETTNPEDLAARLNITVLPQISETEIERFINSGGLQWQPNLKWPPPEAMPAAGAPAPAAGVPMAAAEPIWADGMPASPEQAGNETEAAWVTLFLENHLWVDQRETVSPCCLLDCVHLGCLGRRHRNRLAMRPHSTPLTG